MAAEGRHVGTHRKDYGQDSKHVSSRSHKRRRRVDRPTIPPADSPKPQTVEELREARLKSLSTRPEERRKMKYEYVTTSVERVERVEPSKSDPKARSAVASVSKSPSKRTKTTSKVESDESRKKRTSAGDYVYPRRASQAPAQDQTTTAQARKETSSTTTGEKRRKPSRRHTEPVKQARASTIESPRSEDTKTDKPHIHRSRTSYTHESRPSLSRSATTTRAETEVSMAPTDKTESRRKGTSIISAFLGPRPPTIERKISCLTCGADDILVSQSAKLPCTHRMCHSCLKRIFKLSVTDPAHMPPRCCTDQHIDLKHVDKLFSQDFKKTWNRRFVEYKTKNRLYCPARGCGEWIKPNHITLENGRKVGKCKHCGMRVCGICNNKMHTSRDCPKDPETKRFVQIAKEKGWQKCYSCGATVELKEGCNHMTCRCTAEFCMVCGLKWKSCDCPWFNYEALDAHLGNPVRFQEEMDRRREQEVRDEELARRMQRLGMDGAGGVFGNHVALNQNFIQQAREALTANYAHAEQAARDLLNGLMAGRENVVPGGPVPVEDLVMVPDQGVDVTHRRRRTARRYRVGEGGVVPADDAH